MRSATPVLTVITIALAVCATAAPAATTTGLVPVNDLGTNLYLGQYQGGLYPNGSNAMPATHSSVGLSRAAAVVPRDVFGNPSPTGKYVLISVGMSNTTQEFSTFMQQAASNANGNKTTLRIVDGAAGGQTAAT